MVGVAVGVDVGTGEALGTGVTLGAAVVGIGDGTMPPPHAQHCTDDEKCMSSK